jgi:teichuronic acid exporter
MDRAAALRQTQTLKQSVVRAVGWTTATRFVGQLAAWAMTLVTIRFLRPQDYGLMAITMTVTGFIASLGSVGIIDAVIQDRSASDQDLRSVFGLVLLLNGGCLVLLCVLAYPAAWFYGQPRLVALLQAASLLFVGTAFQAMPRAMLVKRLDLKTVSRIDLVAAIACGGLVLTLAVVGFGVWSLLAGPILAASLQALGLSLAADYCDWPSFRFGNLTRVARFGGLRTGENILWNIYINSDIFIIGKLLGHDVVGIYYVARNLAAMPVRQFVTTVKPAAFPAFALLQDDRAEAFRHVVKAIRLVAFVCFPVLFGLAAVAPEIVPLVLGRRWSAAAMPVAILAVAMTLQVVGPAIQPFLAGMGEFGASFRNTLFATILFPTAFAIGSHWGLMGVCVAWLVACPIQLANLFHRVSMVAQASIGSLVSPLLAPLAGSLIMYAVVRTFATASPFGGGGWTDLTALVITGMLVYFGFTVIMMRPVVHELVNLAKGW